MESLKIFDIANAIGGKIVNVNNIQEIQGISTDSRKIKTNDLFIALVGDNFDGHEFLSSAFEKGAAAAIVSTEMQSDYPQIVVGNTLKALKDLARFYRKRFNIPVVAVTGSSGKTSTKEMIASVLQEKLKVHKTQKNFNNEIGLPLTVFDLDSQDEISVLEMGMNNLGEIERLASVACPSIGVITNVGTAHIENLGSRENILKAKMEITSYFNKDNILIINGDDDYLSTINNKPYKIIKTSLFGKGDYNAKDIVDYGPEGVEFKTNYRGHEYLFKVNVPGVHNIYNALSAIAVAEIFNLTAEEIKVGILNFKPGNLRMNVINLTDNIKIIEDCYNANVESMKVAINVLSSFTGSRRIAVLGDMFELGQYREEAHREVGRHLNGKCEIVVCVGEDAEFIYSEIKDKLEGSYFKTKEEACQYLKDIIRKNDVLLVKASRGMRMEDITSFLIEDRKRGI
jgi:UDP-N-acetylmuramoyl-tripeptide--D-alanyl-D-alanine ligase